MKKNLKKAGVIALLLSLTLLINNQPEIKAEAKTTTTTINKETQGKEEAYAIFSEDDGSLTFIRSEEEPVVGEIYNGKIVSRVYSDFEEVDYNNDYDEEKDKDISIKAPWNHVDNISYKVKSVVFKDVIKPVSTCGWFLNFDNCEIMDLSKLDTSNVKNMENMFTNCSKLNVLDLRNMNTGKVTDMDWMFYNCTSLESVNLSNFDTSNVKEMNFMFNACTSLKTLDLSNFDILNITGMDYMFAQCTSLEKLDISSFDISNVKSMMNMFCYNKSLTDLKANENLLDVFNATH